MSDKRLRELERRWRETGDVDDEAALLRERLRVGDPEEETLTLCAAVGVPAALRALGSPPQELARAAELLERSQRARLPRLAHAGIEAARPAWEAELGGETGMEVVAKALRTQIFDAEVEVPWEGLADWVEARRAWAQEAASAPARHAAEAIHRGAVLLQLEPLRWGLVGRELLDHAEQAVGAEAVRAQLAAELGPVLLETGDPLAERSPDLSRDGFWALIAEARTPEGGDEDHLTELLVARSFSELIDFGRCFHDCWYRAYRADLWDAAYLIEGGCSDDGFMDFRAGLIGLGQEVFERALQDPDSLAELGDLYIPSDGPGFALQRALERKCGGEEARLPDLLQHWRSHGELIGELGEESTFARRFPRLWALHGENV